MRIKILLFFFLISTFIYSQKQNPSIGFIENKGQIVDQKGKQNNEVLYLLNTPGLNVQIKKNGFSYDVYETKQVQIKQKEFIQSKALVIDSEEKPNYKIKTNYHRIDIDFLGSNSNVEIINTEKSLDYDNYYNVPNCPNGITNVHKFKKITYKNIYSNIDLDFFIPKDTTKTVEYNFIVRPGGKISDIQLKIKGGKTELIDNKIRMTTRFGKMEETIPMSWIENEKERKEIAVGYKQIAKNIYGFEGNVNTSNKTIVIDPVPIRLWGTYYGSGYQAFKTNTTKTDNNNNVLFTGLTYNSNNVGTSGSFQSTGIPIWETAFIAKMNSNGVRIWGTYIKNNTYEARINDLITNSSNDIYVAGYTWDQDGLTNTITTPGSFREFGSAFTREGMLIKFNENGQRIWGTFYGGSGFDEIRTIDLDSNENLIIAGQTNSPSGISTNNSYLINNPNSDFYSLGFFAKFNSDGNRIYGSYYQGMITFCKIDSNDNVYFAGQYSENANYTNITTINAHQTECFNTDIFIVKFDSNFNREWCTYYGGNEYTSSFGNSDRITGLDSDNLNNIYLIGTTSSSNNIATIGSFKENQVFGGIDAFIAKFNSSGIRVWGTYFGGNSTVFNETGESGCVSPEGDIYIAGNTRNSSEIISTPNSFQLTPNGSDECFFTKFDTNGNLIWCSYYGTPSQDYSLNIFFKNNIIYLLGNSTAIATNGNNLGTPGTHMPNGEGFFLGKFQDCLSSPQASAINPCIGSDLQLNASGGTNYTWTGPNGFTSSQQNPIIINANSTHSGQYSCAITGTGGCDNTITLNVVVGDNEAPTPTITNLPAINGDCHTVISTIPTALDNCVGTINATTTNPLNYSIPGNYTITWNYTDGNGNSSTQTQNVTIASVVLPTLTSPQQFCIQQNATLNSIAITGTNILWYDSQTGGNLLPTNTLLQIGVTYYASQTINGCESERVPVLIQIQNTTSPTGNATQSFCSTANATLNDIAITGTAIIWYDSLSGNTVLSATTLLQNGITYYASQTVNNCESVNRTPITIQLINTLNANDFSDYLCDDLNNGHEKIDLSTYNTSLISSTIGNTFSYFKSLLGAQNQTPSEKINNYTNYHLTVGTSHIYVRIDNINTCHQIVVLNLTLYSKPIIQIDEVTPICQGSSITINAGNFNEYLWSTGEKTSSISIANAGDYWVTVTEYHLRTNCSSRKDFKVVNSNKATIQNIIISDWSDNNNSISIITTNGSIGDYEYSIDGISFQNSSTFNNLPTGEYTVYVRDRNGCGVENDTVYLITYPKFFTPNGDGQNDFWKIKFTNKEPNLIINIYNRFGKLLKTLNNDSQGWDGNYLGQPLPSDDYWFTVVRPDGKEYKEHFALKR